MLETNSAGAIQTSYVYGLMGVLSQRQGQTTNYLLGLLDTLTLPNGITSDYGYDNRQRVTGLVQTQNAASAPLASYSYTYDLAGNRTNAMDNSAGDVCCTRQW